MNQKNYVDEHITVEDCENGIIKLSTITDLSNSLYKNHLESPCQKLQSKFEKVRHSGLCITLKLTCTNCNISSDPIKMYDEGYIIVRQLGGCFVLNLACIAV